MMDLSFEAIRSFIFENSQQVAQLISSFQSDCSRLTINDRSFGASALSVTNSLAAKVDSFALRTRVKIATLLAIKNELNAKLSEFFVELKSNRKSNETHCWIVVDNANYGSRLVTALESDSLTKAHCFLFRIVESEPDIFDFSLEGSYDSHRCDENVSKALKSNFNLSFGKNAIGNADAVGFASEKAIAPQKRAAVYDVTKQDVTPSTTKYPKDQKTFQTIIQAIRNNILFSSYSPQEQDRIVEVFQPLAIKANELVIRQGEAGEYFYVIESGRMDLYLDGEAGVRLHTGHSLGPGSSFGELALLYNIPRTATVLAVEDSMLWRVDRHTYRFVVAQSKQNSILENTAFVRGVHVLGKCLGEVLNAHELDQLVMAVEQEVFSPGDIIIRQDQTGDCFYIIKEGEVSVRRRDKGSSHQLQDDFGREVAKLSSGGYFGEKALLADDVRQASCIATSRVVCLSLSREMFIRLVGRWSDLAEAGAAVPTATNVASASPRNEGSKPTATPTSLALSDIERLTVIGRGAFGAVFLARNKKTEQALVLKIQSKKAIQDLNMQNAVSNEIRLTRGIDHPFVVKLFAAFQDKVSIFMAMELIQGGDFFSYLQRAGKLSEDKARFYSANVLSGLEAMHSQDIAYRDLKPENLVMDHRGYLKLVDLGLAKKIDSGKTWTLCGTPDYIAPEIILNKGHDKAVDYWALGVLVFEMIDGYPPFYNDNPMKVYQNIISGTFSRSQIGFSGHLVDLLEKLLQRNQVKRLGNAKGGIAEIFIHKWFGSFDWKGLVKYALSPPFIPEIHHALDVSNFGDVEADEDGAENAKEETDWVAEIGSDAL